MKKLLPIAFAVLPQVTVAHPHIFIETALTIVVDEAGAVTGVEIVWHYDDFFSLLLVEDLGIDEDGDLQLEPEEVVRLQEAVLAWPDGFEGDTWVDGPDGPVALAARKDHRVDYVDGRVIETHFRPLTLPLPAGDGVNIRVFDQGYYTAYSLAGPADVRGPESCEVWTTYADLDAAYSLVDELLYGRPASTVGPDEYFPEVGEAFADTVTVTCNVG